MLKPQDCIILLKLIANPDNQWSQRELAKTLSISLSEVNAGIKRLFESNLLRKKQDASIVPVYKAAEEFLINGLKYIIPAKLSAFTRGMVTAYAAPIFADKIALGDDPVPVWPDAYGKTKGVTLEPLHPCVVKSLRAYPDKSFYELLVLIDVVRIGKARERNIAIKLLKVKLKNDK